MKFEITRTLGIYDDEKPIKNCEEYFYNRVFSQHGYYGNSERATEIFLEDPNIIESWRDENKVLHKKVKLKCYVVEINSLEELYQLTKENCGRIVFETDSVAGLDGYIEIYDDYRE